jgi:predicted SAM-dependent methyltransferase
MIKEIRKKCIICNNEKTSDFLKLTSMPVFMGTNKNSDELYSDMTFTECPECNSVQIKEVIEPKILYMNNHNLNVVGNMWKNHYENLTEFISDDIVNKVVLEIGDPSYKISKNISDKTSKWLICEVNPNMDITPPKNVVVIKEFFENISNIEKSDVVIHSHLLEHIVDPLGNLSKTYEILNDDGLLIFSVPNLESILKLNQSPNAVLHFEHTFYFSEEMMKEVLRSSGFEVIDIKKFESHSVFFKCRKTKQTPIDTDKLKIMNEGTSNLFLSNFNLFKNKIEVINEKLMSLHNSDVFLYGCHISSQFLINIGLNTERIQNILDNSDSKFEKRLYGTDLVTKSPLSIKMLKDPIVITSHMSIYEDEINKQLKEINESVILV